MTAIAIYGGLFISAFLAATILPSSSEAVLIGLLAAGRGDPILLLLVATIGNTLGSVTNWFLGHGIDTLRTKSWFPVTPERYETASLIFRRYVAWTLLLAWLSGPMATVMPQTGSFSDGVSDGICEWPCM